MIAEEIRALKDELDVASINLTEILQRHASKLILHGENGQAGALLVFERVVYQHVGNVLLWYSSRAAVAPELPTGRPAKRGERKRAPKGQGAHRHSFGSEGICSCGAARQRAPKRSAGSPEQRTVPLPIPDVNSRPTLGEHAVDPYADGTMGGSSARSGRR